jgi:hypothetical protein
MNKKTVICGVVAFGVGFVVGAIADAYSEPIQQTVEATLIKLHIKKDTPDGSENSDEHKDVQVDGQTDLVWESEDDIPPEIKALDNCSPEDDKYFEGKKFVLADDAHKPDPSDIADEIAKYKHATEGYATATPERHPETIADDDSEDMDDSEDDTPIEYQNEPAEARVARFMNRVMNDDSDEDNGPDISEDDDSSELEEHNVFDENEGNAIEDLGDAAEKAASESDLDDDDMFEFIDDSGWNSDDGYDKITLMYFPDDDILVASKYENPINPNYMIGDDAYNELLKGESDTIMVCNNNLGADIKINVNYDINYYDWSADND